MATVVSFGVPTLHDDERLRERVETAIKFRISFVMAGNQVVRTDVLAYSWFEALSIGKSALMGDEVPRSITITPDI